MRASPEGSGGTGVTGLWPLFWFSAVLLSLAVVAFLYSLGIWVSFALAWVAFGLLCWVVVLRYFSPTPHINETVAPASEPPSKLFELRDTPAMVVLLIPISLISPFLLAFLSIRAQKRHERRKA